MEIHWVTVLGCLSIVTAPCYAAVTTQNTLVATSSFDATTKAEPLSEEVTTEGSLAPIKLTEMEVISDVSQRYAHTMVVALLRNPAKSAQEANFRVLLPETAFISGFVMILNGKPYKAYVKEKDEAKEIYEQAVSQGFGAAHVTTKARDSNQFVVSVNVEPLSIIIFKLTYEELLIRRNSLYNHVINLHPGVLVPKLSVTVHIKEVQKITELRIPEIRTGNEVDATENDAQNTKAVVTKGYDDGEAIITFIPSLEEQKKLMEIFAQKSKESGSHTRRWNQVEGDNTSAEQGVLGQFVVQYDVERPKDGEILVKKDFFVHFFAPKSLPPLNKYVVFVLDTSGSMVKRKINQLREAMQTIFSDLNPGDYFSIVEFDSAVTVHELKEADQVSSTSNNYQFFWSNVEKPPTLVPPSLATPENIAKAKVIISRLRAYGGTNIGSALDIAVSLIHKRTEWGKKSNTNTAGAVADDNEVYNIERMKNLEPIIIFLTDGDPTVGQTNTATIIDRITVNNHGEDKATIFSLAFGEDADRKFLRKLSLRNDGFMRHIYEAADAHLQLQDFYRQVSTPVLSDVKVVYPTNQVKNGTLTRSKFRRFYAGSEVVVAGQIADNVVELTPQVVGFRRNENGFEKKPYEDLPTASRVSTMGPNQPLERLWAYLTIKQFLDDADANEENSEIPEEIRPTAKALALALQYEFVTPLTSLVVVKPNATDAIDPESVDKQKSMASGSTNYRPPTTASTILRRDPGTTVDPGPPVSKTTLIRRDPGTSDNGRPTVSNPTLVRRDPANGDYGGATTPTILTSTSESLIARYGLLEFSWVEPLLNVTADTLVLEVNGTIVDLKLSTDSEAPKTAGSDVACNNAVDGGSGACVYLSRCDSAKNISVDTYKTTYCSINEGYAGVCCNVQKIDVVY